MFVHYITEADQPGRSPYSLKLFDIAQVYVRALPPTHQSPIISVS